MKTSKKITIFLLTFFILAQMLSCKTEMLPVKPIKIIRHDGNEFIVQAEMATKTVERNRGFMERKKIPDGTGMLFVFERDQILSFWMKNTPHPLSIAYIDSKGVICDIFDMEPYNLTSITSTVPVRYALEVPQGWYKKNGITKGDVVILPNSL